MLFFLLLPNAQSKTDNAAKVSTSALVTSQTGVCVCVAARWTRRAKQTSRHPAGEGARCLYAPNKRFLQLIECEAGYSAHRSGTQLLNSSPFWCNMNGKAHTDQVHIDWHSTAIFQCQKNGDQIEFGSLLIPPTEQRRGVQRKNSVQHLLWISHSLQRHCSPWHWFPSFTFISFSLLSDAQMWRLMSSEVFFFFF